MDDLPYTLPDEDPFNISPLFTKPRRRRSSMLDKWIDQQSNTTNYLDPDHLPQAGTRSNPYLAYPDMAGRFCLQESAARSTLTVASYDLIDDDDIPEHTPDSTLETPNLYRSSKTPFHSVALSFRSDSPPATSPKHSRMLFFGSGRNNSSQHNRSSSLGTLRDSDSPSKWRPTVLGYFSSSSTSQTSVPPSETVYTPSRPSISSTNTYTSSSTPPKHLRVPSTPSKLSLVESMRSRRRSFGTLLSKPGTENLPSLASLSLEDEQPPSPKSTVSRIPFAPKPPFPPDQDPMPHTVVSQATQPQVAFSAKDGTLSRFSSRNQKKKKKLVISGISAGEARKFDNVKRWCESFGEVSQILRMPNGDLHVHFRSAEVADTVCRLRAKVFIAGVGSVNLSWYTGTKH